jgi:hypothetical protein
MAFSPYLRVDSISISFRKCPIDPLRHTRVSGTSVTFATKIMC